MNTRMFGLVALALPLVLLGGAANAAEINQPRGFVDLGKVAPDILVDMRYATPNNFTGRRVPGYRGNRCVLARPVALALARVQKSVRKDGYTLKVYDCYRPARGVRAFFSWAQGRFGRPNKAFYPRISRDRIIPLGYIAKRSSHSRGTAVDLTLVKLSAIGAANTQSKSARTTKSASCIEPVPENPPASINMGTSWDCFDRRSHTYHPAISAQAKANRERLLRAMRAEGFRNYRREWWHYWIALRRFQRLRDFPIE